MPELLDGDLRRSVLGSEQARVRYCRAPRFTGPSCLAEFTVAQPGPRLVILNTVVSAAVFARELRQAGHDVRHLSTALMPLDRDRVLPE